MSVSRVSLCVCVCVDARVELHVDLDVCVWFSSPKGSSCSSELVVSLCQTARGWPGPIWPQVKIERPAGLTNVQRIGGGYFPTTGMERSPSKQSPITHLRKQLPQNISKWFATPKEAAGALALFLPRFFFRPAGSDRGEVLHSDLHFGQLPAHPAAARGRVFPPPPSRRSGACPGWMCLTLFFG